MIITSIQFHQSSPQFNSINHTYTSLFHAQEQFKHHKSIPQFKYYISLSTTCISNIQSRTHCTTRTHCINSISLNIRILHRTICISNINYTLTQAPSLFKFLGLSLASPLNLWFLIHFKYNLIEYHTKSLTIVHVFYVIVMKLQ